MDKEGGGRESKLDYNLSMKNIMGSRVNQRTRMNAQLSIMPQSNVRETYGSSAGA